MTYVLRQLVSFLLLPAVVAGVIPVWIARRNHVALGATDAAAVLAIGAGAIVGVIGLWLFAYSLAHFATRGRGTLAPWDPPRELVVSGPYRFVRNPMIFGVCFILAGEALVLRSAPHAWWAFVFTLANLILIPLVEEPMLRARFGRSYDEYAANVRRLIPRLEPWAPGATTREAERPSAND
jgi:protein-S-isoprenylcysteine O-methyltransferase Ste14